MAGEKEWRRVSRAANGSLVVSVTLADENLSAKWSVKAYLGKGKVKAAVIEARKYAAEILGELREAGE